MIHRKILNYRWLRAARPGDGLGACASIYGRSSVYPRSMDDSDGPGMHPQRRIGIMKENDFSHSQGLQRASMAADPNATCRRLFPLLADFHGVAYLPCWSATRTTTARIASMTTL